MSRPLRALIVEDAEQDAQLLLRDLRRSGYDVTFVRVDTAEAMGAALDARTWDIVLSDYSMPRFSAPAALAVLKERNLDLPFIIISGTVNEDIAVAALQAGAHDFMAKGRLERLATAIARELENAVLREEQKKMQDELMTSDRMASMGTLAAGVAHEINNPLACVVANLDMARSDIAALAEKFSATALFAEVQAGLDDAQDAALRIRDIVRDLRIFSRSPDKETGAIDVHRILDSTLRMTGNEVRHRARIVKKYGDIALVEASESRLGQVFLNLVMNAAQAITEGRAESNEIRIITGMTDGGRVGIAIEDTGPGISPEVLSRLFTPFFTTKPVGMGTGLGLSICRRIIADLGGDIDVESTLGRGTVFRISLPAAKAEVVDDVVPESVDQPSVRRGRILVVDDEPMLTRLVHRALSPEHDVTLTGGAETALGIIEKGERFDVILSDLMMPQMTGMDLHAHLQRIAPDQAERMIFVTGGAFTERAHAFLTETPNQRIEKPFGAAKLRALVNERIR